MSYVNNQLYTNQYLAMNTGFLFNTSYFWLYGMYYGSPFERFKKFNLEFIDINVFYLKVVYDKFKKNWYVKLLDHY